MTDKRPVCKHYLGNVEIEVKSSDGTAHTVPGVRCAQRPKPITKTMCKACRQHGVPAKE